MRRGGRANDRVHARAREDQALARRQIDGCRGNRDRLREEGRRARQDRQEAGGRSLGGGAEAKEGEKEVA